MTSRPAARRNSAAVRGVGNATNREFTMGHDANGTDGSAATARRIQQFLEAAAPIILESRTLDSDRMDAVIDLAERMHVDRAALRRELRWLAQRGVITSVAWDRLGPMPPPSLPDATASTGTASTGTASTGTADTQPKPTPKAPTDAPRAAPKSRRQQRAASRTAKSSRAPVANVAPADAFGAWLNHKLTNYPSSLLTEDDERSLIGVGVHRHHLAEVLARDIVREVAQRRGIRPERDLARASEHSTVGSAGVSGDGDEQLRQFFDQVAPILTLHRGINTQSRILLSAVAQQMGLSDAQLDRAITQLQQNRSNDDADDPQQAERLESYRRYLRRAVAQLPDSIVTFKTQQRLEEAGEYFHGVAPSLIAPAIKQVAAEVGARFLSRQQALDHVAGLMDDAWQRGLTITGETRVRIYAEGTRWGLEPMDIEAIMRERAQTRRTQLAIERRRVRHILMATSAALVLVAALLAWIAWPMIAKSRGTQGADKPVVPAPVELPADWRSPDLRIAIANSRSALPELKTVLAKLDGQLPSGRATAYERLAQTCLQEKADPNVRLVLRPLLIYAYACEPSDSAATALAKTMLDCLVQGHNQLPSTPAALDTVFWASGTVLQMWHNPDVAAARRDALTPSLEKSLGMTLDLTADLPSLLRSGQAAIVDSVYRRLTSVAAEQPSLVVRLFDGLAQSATDCLDDNAAERRNAELLVAALPALGDQWDTFRDVIRQLVQSREPHIVLQMAKSYARVSDESLRSFLATTFSARIGIDLRGVSAEEFAERVRATLGIVDPQQAVDRWANLDQHARAALADQPVQNTRAEVLLDATIELTYFATLAAALQRGEAGVDVFRTLEKEGPPEFDTGIGPFTAEKTRPFATGTGVAAVKFVQKYVADLRTARFAPQRIRMLETIANYADRAPDIDVATGQSLAKYLTRYKTNETEQTAVLAAVRRVAQWDAVRLGLADALAGDPRRGTQLAALYAKVMGKAVDLDTDAGRQTVRNALLQSVVVNLSTISEQSGDLDQVYGKATKAIAGLYQQQVTLFGVPADAIADTDRVSTLMAALARQVAANLDQRKLSDALEHELSAARLIVDNDLQYSVLVAHLWARTLAARITRDRPDSAAQVQELLARLEQLDRRSKNLFEQLRHTHAILLNLWLLYKVDAGARMVRWTLGELNWSPIT